MKNICLILIFSAVFSINSWANELYLNIDGKRFDAELFDSESANILSDKMPFIARMKPLSKNGKYFYIPEFIPGESKKLAKISTGDILLYDNRYVMIFTNDFIPSHKYTKIGRIKNPIGLKNAFQPRKVSIRFERK